VLPSRLRIDRRAWIVFVAGHARDDGACGFHHLVIALVRERHKNSDGFCGYDASSFCLTVGVCKCFCDEEKLLRRKRMFAAKQCLFVTKQTLFVTKQTLFLTKQTLFVTKQTLFVTK